MKKSKRNEKITVLLTKTEKNLLETLAAKCHLDCSSFVRYTLSKVFNEVEGEK